MERYTSSDPHRKSEDITLRALSAARSGLIAAEDSRAAILLSRI
jgi:hypothetical protein